MTEFIPDEIKARADLEAKELEFARNYLVFVQDPRAKAILGYWTKTLGKRRTPVDASLQSYARNEEMRAFLEGIHEQIVKAETGKIS